MPDRRTLTTLIREAVSTSALTPAEVAERIERARRIDEWRALCPGLHIEGDRGPHGEPTEAPPSRVEFAHAQPPHAEPAPATARAADAERGHLDTLRRDGYFQTGVLVDAAARTALVTAVETIVAEGWPPVFAFLFDEPWALLRAPRVAGIVRSVLGPEHRQLPNMWIHRVPPHASARGWPAHTDGGPETWTVRADGLPNRVTCWIALTDATLTNGCLALVPKRFAPAGLDGLYESGSLGFQDLRALLGGTRPIPAAAGTMACWDFSVLHWSSMRQESAEPARIAVSYELLSAADRPLAEEQPLLDPFAPLPSFAERLVHVSRSLSMYGKYEIHAERFRPVAEGLAAR